MAIIRLQRTLQASENVTNILSGSKFEFLARPSAVSVYASQSLAIDDVEIDFTLGNVVVFEDVSPNVQSVSPGNVNRREDMIGAGVGEPGDRIQIRLTNTDAVATPLVGLLVEINELG